MGGPRGETLGVREGGRCDTAALSPQGGRDISPSEPGIKYQVGQGDARGRRPRRTAEERDRYVPPLKSAVRGVRRCRDTI